MRTGSKPVFDYGGLNAIGLSVYILSTGLFIGYFLVGFPTSLGSATIEQKGAFAITLILCFLCIGYGLYRHLKELQFQRAATVCKGSIRNIEYQERVGDNENSIYDQFPWIAHVRYSFELPNGKTASETISISVPDPASAEFDPRLRVGAPIEVFSLPNGVHRLL